MSSLSYPLSIKELASLREVGKAFNQSYIPREHAVHLLALRLIYKMLGHPHITTAGRTVLRGGQTGSEDAAALDWQDI